MESKIDIPNTGLPTRKISVNLDGNKYELYFAWNRISLAWYLTVSTGNQVLVAGVRVAKNRPILRAYRTEPGMFKGDFVFLDIKSSSSDPTLYGLGTDYVLIYTEEVLDEALLR
jgi:hypothetical protein